MFYHVLQVYYTHGILTAFHAAMICISNSSFMTWHTAHQIHLNNNNNTNSNNNYRLKMICQTNCTRPPKGPKMPFFVPGNLELWPWPSNLSQRGTKHVFPVNLSQIRSAVPEIATETPIFCPWWPWPLTLPVKLVWARNRTTMWIRTKSVQQFLRYLIHKQKKSHWQH